MLLIFLDWPTLIVGLSMPISIIATFMFMQIGYSFNLLTLIGISCSVGVLVSNSVVVIENIFRYKELGKNRRDAAMQGTSEIALAVMASTLTNIVVFIPIASMTTLVGQFFREFALTVTFATIFSLVTSFTVTPMLASRILKKAARKTALASNSASCSIDSPPGTALSRTRAKLEKTQAGNHYHHRGGSGGQLCPDSGGGSGIHAGNGPGQCP